MKFREIKKCRLCGGGFIEILDLGEMPPANSFLKHDDFVNEEKFPLAVHLCKDCKSLQLRHTVDPSILFKNYHYMTGASRPLVQHFESLANIILKKFISSKSDLVIEIGSNDGSLLAMFKDKARVLGIDPADNVAEVARSKGVSTKVGFFNKDLSKEIVEENGKAKVVVANNVMAHIDDLRDVFEGVKNTLSPEGVFIFEVHWVGNLLNDGGFDQIYHEHIYYHSLHSLNILLNSLGMVLKHLELIPVHGESMRVYAGLSGEASSQVVNHLELEDKMGLRDDGVYVDFSKKVEKNKNDLVALLTDLKKKNKKIVGYGAPAKGNTLMNYLKIDSGIIDFIIDTTPAKQGTFTPGTHIPVVSPDNLIEKQPDYILLLSWNYKDAILEKEKNLREKGVKFIIPVPEVKIV